MKVLVTGAAGFIGSNLAEKLLRRGDTVIGLDNFNNYYDPQKKRANETRLNSYPSFQMIEEDIRKRQMILDLFASERFDAVAHLAAMAGVRNAVKYPALYIEVDYNGTQNLMDGARFNNVSNFVFASTSSVYGDTTQIPFVETDPCDRPLQPYAAAKRGAEILGHAYHHLFDLNFTATRFFTVYGPNNRPDMMAYLVAESIRQGKEIPLYNNGEMYRDWTSVEDITDGLVLAIDKPLGYEILNLGCGEPTLLRDFITLIEDLAGGKAHLINQPKISADVTRTYADISKARRLLNYNPQISVADGVRQFWHWYEQQA
ncbi:MAG: GDP-mannose 4,6-dehydratase [Ardenticatenaceae bacterium]|nr:GDP-mannose 4,6-dehydratase [Ardenticatenaceae bacterium]